MGSGTYRYSLEENHEMRVLKFRDVSEKCRCVWRVKENARVMLNRKMDVR